MRTDILDFLQGEIYERCKRSTNPFGMGIYHHIKAVVENASFLAEKHGADKEIVMIAAWLHDIASVTDKALYREHHIYGAQMARRILEGFHYEEEKIALVEACILNHRGSVCNVKNSVEEMCVADADAVSHFDSVPSLLYMAYVRKGMTIEEGRDFVKNKLERSFRKLSVGSREYYQGKYQQAIGVLTAGG